MILPLKVTYLCDYLSVMDTLTDLYPELMARARAFVRQPGWSKSRLAIESGLHANALRSLDDPAWQPRVGTLLKIEAVMDAAEAPPAGPAEAA